MARKNKKFIASIIMAMMMVLAMVPSMAFADTAEIGGNTYTSTIQAVSPGSVPVGQSVIMSSTYETNYTGQVHVDWTISNGTGSATINTHQGQLVGVSAGTVTVTATLKTGVAGTGNGDQSGCSGEALASNSITFRIANSNTYGYQGIGGNTMKMLSPVTPSFDQTTTRTIGSTDYTVYNNNMTNVPISNGECIFGYTMSAGVNNFKYDTFKKYEDEITISAVNSGLTTSPSVAYDSFDTDTKTIKLKASNLVAGESYILSFGPDVCGNNIDKKLGCYVEFNVAIAPATASE